MPWVIYRLHRINFGEHPSPAILFYARGNFPHLQYRAELAKLGSPASRGGLFFNHLRHLLERRRSGRRAVAAAPSNSAGFGRHSDVSRHAAGTQPGRHRPDRMARGQNRAAGFIPAHGSPAPGRALVRGAAAATGADPAGVNGIALARFAGFYPQFIYLGHAFRHSRRVAGGNRLDRLCLPANETPAVPGPRPSAWDCCGADGMFRWSTFSAPQCRTATPGWRTF